MGGLNTTFSIMEQGVYDSMVGELETLHRREIEIDRTVDDLQRRDAELDELNTLYIISQSAQSGYVGFSPPRNPYWEEMGDIRSQLRVLRTEKEEVVTNRDALIQEVQDFYSGIAGIPNEDLPYEDLVALGDIARRSGSSEVAIDMYSLAYPKTASKTFVIATITQASFIPARSKPL